MSDGLTRETGTIACRHVADDLRRVDLVHRDLDGSWQHLCALEHNFGEVDDFVIVGIHHLLSRQPDLEKVTRLTPGRTAVFFEGEWRRRPEKMG